MEGIASEIDLRWWLKNLMEQKRGEPKRRRGVCIRIPVGTATNTGGAQDVKGAGKVAFNIKKSRVKCVKRPSKKERKKERKSPAEETDQRLTRQAIPRR